MRSLTVLALLSLAVPATATAGNTTRSGGDQAQRQDSKRVAWQCAARDKDRPGRDGTSKAECRVTKPLPPVVDPTPMFLP